MGYRDIPLGPMAVSALRAWLDTLTRQSNVIGTNADRLLFPTESGQPYTYEHLYRHVLIPVMVAASKILKTESLVTYGPKPDNGGKPIVRNMGHFAGPYCPLVVRPKYSFHELRHVFASLRIAEGADPKTVQVLMGHSSIQVTFDIYGHLWNNATDAQAAAKAAELRVMNARKD